MMALMTDRVLFPASAMPDDDWWGALWPDPKGTLVNIGITPGMTVIDLCCGNGYFTVPLASLVGTPGRVVAIDLDADMLATARSRMGQAVDKVSAAACAWIVADATMIDEILLDEDKADALIIANTFHGVPDQAALSASVAGVLKPGGAFIVINWHAHPREQTVVLGQARGPKEEMRMTPQDVEQVVAAAGFVVGDIIELPPYHYAAVFHVAQARTRD